MTPDPAPSAPAADLNALRKAKTQAVLLRDRARTDPFVRALAKRVDAGEQAAADLASAKASLHSAHDRIAGLEATVRELNAALASAEAEASDLRRQLTASLTKPAAGRPAGAKPAPAAGTPTPEAPV